MSTSPMRGTLRTTTSSLGEERGGERGSAPFLFPAGTTVPESGRPPSMTNFCTRRGYHSVPLASQPCNRLARKRGISSRWVASDSLRKHLLGVEAAMVATRAGDEDEEMYAVTGSSTTSTTTAIRTSAPATRGTR